MEPAAEFTDGILNLMIADVRPAVRGGRGLSEDDFHFQSQVRAAFKNLLQETEGEKNRNKSLAS